MAFSLERLPAVLLVALVVLSPWPFGGAHPQVARLIAIIGSLGALAGLAASLRLRPFHVGGGHRLVVWLAAIWTLAWLELVPLPAAVQAVVAPGPARVWHPALPAAAAVLGAGARPISVDPAATLRWIAFSAAVLGLAFAAREGLRSRMALLRASAVVVSGAILVAVYGLVARLAFGDKLFGRLSVPTIAPFGPFVSKNHFAGYVELAACLALGLAAGLADEAREGPDWLSWLGSRRSAWVVAAWGAAMILVLAVPVSLSRGGVVSLAAGVAAFVAIRLGTRRRRAAHARGGAVAAGGLVVTIVALALLLPGEARERVQTIGGVDSSGAYRLEVWRDSLRLFASSPAVGSGFGAFADALPRFKTGAGDVRVEHAENDYLELLCEGGLLSVAFAGLALFALAGAAWRAVRDEPHRLSRGVRAGALAGLVAVLVHSAVDFNLRIPSNALLAALLLACVLPFRSATGDPESAAASPEPEARRGPYGAMLLVPLGLALGLSLLGPWSSHTIDTETVRRAATGGSGGLRKEELEVEVTAHLQHRPADAYAWAVLAWLRLPHAPRDAGALAAWAQQLDPQHAALKAAAQRVRDAAQSQPRTP